MRKIRLIGARRYIQGFPPYQPKVDSYPIEFAGEDALLPIEKYEGDEQFKETFKHFRTQMVEERERATSGPSHGTRSLMATPAAAERLAPRAVSTSGEGVVFDIQRFTIHDGPGIRTQVFMKKCPLRCLWCSNPESISSHLELGVFPDRCIGTERCEGPNGIARCVEVCIRESEACLASGKKELCALIVKDGKVVRKNWNLCTNCLKCTIVCPSEALVVFGQVMTVEEVMREVEKDRDFYVESGGGVTLAGGDPLAQPEFTLRLLIECKRVGFHTCLETEGHSSWKIMEKMIPHVDMWLYDIKHMDPQKHKGYTGVDNRLILDNLEKLASRAKAIVIKTPIVPGYTDSAENIEAIARFIQALGEVVKQYQLLPYFSFMRSKYEALGQEFHLPLKGPSKERLKELCDLARSCGAPAVVGAYSEIEVS